MTSINAYTLFMVSLVLFLGGTLFYGDVPAEKLVELAHSAESLQNPAFNHALRESFSDGDITYYDYFNLSAMANRLEIEAKQVRAETILNKITNTAK
ncbi:MAG: hypothetical protein ACRC4K_15355 [Plesiomonas shigelloides]